MNAIFQFVMRQSGYLAFFFLLLAVASGFDVCNGLWDGVGLHGYVIHQGKTRNGYIVPVWRSFVQMIFFACLGCFMLGIKLWHRAKVSRIVINPRVTGGKGPNVVIFRSQSGRRPRR